jgi:ATP-binding cassette, subfamily B, bacterial
MPTSYHSRSSRIAASPARLAQRSIEFVRGHRRQVAGILCLALILAVLGAADPLVMKFLFDGFGRRDAHTLPLALGGLLALELSRGALGRWLAVLTWKVRIAVDFNMRERLVGKLQALPMDYHSREGVGGTMNKLNQAATGFVGAFGEIAFNVLPAIVYLALSVVAMCRMEWRLALTVLAFTPLPALIGAWAAREQTERERRLLEHWTRLYSRLNEVLAGIRTVKVFSMEQEEHRGFLEGQQAGNDIVTRGVRTDTKTDALRSLAASLARIAAIAFGGVLILRGDITVGSLVAFLGYVSGLFGPVQGLTSIYQTLRKATVALETTYEILDAEEIVQDPSDATEIGRARGEIDFEHVTFAHADGRPLFRDLSMHVRPGETVALVGPSGGGKTTLMSLLLRLYPVGSGTVRLDGRDIRGITAASLRRQIGYVSQDIHLFNDTVASNIAFGTPSASADDIEVAARCANAHDFILSLPDGYDTIIGERGSRLSGGQRQRLAIARAILKNAPVLVLDEATSALDNVSEVAVQEALEHLRVGRTTIIIAHRLSTVLGADRILLVKDGGIVGEGTHAELLQTSSYYAELVGAAGGGLLVPMETGRATPSRAA